MNFLKLKKNNQNPGYKSAYLIEVLWGLNELIFLESLGQHLAPSKLYNFV